MLKYLNFWQNKGILSNLLLPLSYIFLLATKIRRLFAKPISFPGKVICIGNISIGGTGKTQVVKWLAQKLMQDNFKVVIVCKNYSGSFKNSCLVESKHTAKEVGDEAKYLSQFYTTIAATDIKQCLKCFSGLSFDFIILDDFLQNPHIKKDLALLVVDSTRMFGNGRILPAGPLRQHLKDGLQKICAAVFVGPKTNVAIKYKPSFSAEIISNQVFDVNKKYLAFAGIGNPERFFCALKTHGLDVIEKIIFPDHYNYTQQDLVKLNNKAQELNAVLITTPKDAIKLNTSVVIFDPDLAFSLEDEYKIMQIVYEESKKNTLFY